MLTQMPSAPKPLRPPASASAYFDRMCDEHGGHVRTLTHVQTYRHTHIRTCIRTNMEISSHTGTSISRFIDLGTWLIMKCADAAQAREHALAHTSTHTNHCRTCLSINSVRERVWVGPGVRAKLPLSDNLCDRTERRDARCAYVEISALLDHTTRTPRVLVSK